MAYSTPNATYGAKDVKKVAKQTSKSVAKSVGSSVATGAATSKAVKQVAAQTGQAVSAGTSYPAASSSTAALKKQRAARRKKPEPKLKTYTPPKRVEAKVKTELRSSDDRQAQRAAQKRIEIAPHLKAPVKVTRKATLVSPKVAQRAVRQLPRGQQKQAAQQLRTRAQGVKQKVRPSLRSVAAEVGKGHVSEVKNRQKLKQRLERAAVKGTSLLERLDRGYAPDEEIKPRHAALLAEAQGLPGKTYRQIAKGESAFRPGVPNPDDGYPSLWQMTPSVQSDETRAAWDKIAAKHPGGPTNPVTAAEQAKYLAGDSTGVSNYFGTSFMRDENAHLKGGPAAAQKKLTATKPIPKPLRQKAKAVLGPAKTKKVIAKARKSEASTGSPAASTRVKAPPAKDVHKWIVLTESKAEQGAEQGVKPKKAYKVTVRNMSPELQSALVKLGQNTGIPVRVNEGYRTTKRAEEFPSGTASQHHQGNAVDVDNNADYTAEDLAKAGLNNTAVPGEAWHFQPNEPSSSVSTISGGATSSGTSTAPSGVAATFAAAAGTAKTTAKKRRDKKRRKGKRRRPRVSVAALPAALDAADYAVDPSTESYSDYVKKQGVSVGL